MQKAEEKQLVEGPRAATRADAEAKAEEVLEAKAKEVPQTGQPEGYHRSKDRWD